MDNVCIGFRGWTAVFGAFQHASYLAMPASYPQALGAAGHRLSARGDT